MSRLTTVLGFLLLGGLLILIGNAEIFVLPVFRPAMRVWGGEFSTSSQLYFTIANHGTLLIGLLLVALGLTYWKFREATQMAALSACALAAIVLTLLSSVFVDIAIAMPSPMR